jgi:serine/threonine protein kinase/parvulin-like peptidyl-prolyl isomerase
MLKPNDKIGPYTLINKLGRGAFGVVWLAEKRTAITTTKVAIKIPNDEDVDLEAVRQEASLWVQASGHPNVLPIIDADIHDEQVIIVSEYAPDGSLSKWMERQGGKAPSVESAVEMTLEILAGLEHLHKRDIIHRDLKPDNILLQGDTPRLADFGIARILKTTSKSTIATGTPAYMPPEAFDGKRSEQTDVWSVGAIFYQLLSGRLPFPQTEMTSLVGAIITKEPDPLPDSVPLALRKVVEQALQKNPAERYESAGQMRKALRGAFHTSMPDFSEAKTEVFTASSPESTAALAVDSEPHQQQEVVATTMASPIPPLQTEQSPPTQATLTSFINPLQPQPAHVEMRRPKRLRLLGGVIALAIIGIVLTIFLINRRSAGSEYEALSPAEAEKRGIAATVNGKAISISEVDKVVQQQLQGQHTKLSPTEMATARLQVLDTLVQKEALFQHAEKEGLVPSDDEVKQYISNLKTESRMTEEEFQKKLKETGETADSLQNEARRTMAIQKLQDKSNQSITVNESDVENFYNSNKELFVNKRGVGLSMVMVDGIDSNTTSDDAKSEAAAKQKINLIYQQLRSGADFATVAKAQSEDSNSSLKGGDIGFATEQDLKQADFPPDLIRQLFGPMQVGEITPPVLFKEGRWYIFKLTQKHLQTENLTLESPGVRAQVKDALIKQRQDVANAALLETAKNEAKILNYLASTVKPQ